MSFSSKLVFAFVLLTIKANAEDDDYTIYILMANKVFEDIMIVNIFSFLVKI